MTIMDSSNGMLTIGCMDKDYDVGKQVEWQINSKKPTNGITMSDSGSCITLDLNDFNQDRNIKIICRVKNHPSKNPNWQELQGAVKSDGGKRFVG